MSKSTEGQAILNAEETALVDARKAALPADAVARGMFFQGLCDAAKDVGKDLGFGTFVAFKNYPMSLYCDVVAAAAKAVHPEQPFVEGAERVGRIIYPNFSQSMVGRAIFSVAGRDFEKVAGLASRAYSVSIRPGDVIIEHNANRKVVVLMKDIWPFVECFQVGIWKGALEVCGESSDDFDVEHLSLSDARYTIHW